MAEPLAENKVDADLDVASGALRRGVRLGRYELVVPIAVGGMARVWAARMHGQRGFTKLLAIKTILPHLASDPAFEQMFLDEARIASGVHHPNVCEIYELGEERGVLYLAMEWVDGASLSHVLRVAGQVAPLDPRIAGRIVADACAGLHAAHRLVDDAGAPLGVVHRDVSPQNILLTADGNVKVADFGVAKALGQRQHQSMAGQIKGKVSYMAPEQATGKPVDRRSDVFALGCVLYEATTGRKPFRGEGDHHVLQLLQRGEFVPPSRTLTGFPYELERIILRAMSAQPLHRFPGMDGMRLALEEWLAKSGPVVTQSHVAAVVRQRAGVEMDARKEQIRVASSAPVDREGAEPSQLTPSGPAARRSLSGVVPFGDSVEPRGDARRSAPPPAPPPVRRSDEPASGSSAALPAVALASSPRPATAAHYVIAAALGVLGATAVGVGGFFVWHTLMTSPSVARGPVTAVAVAASAAPEAHLDVAHAAPSPPVAARARVETIAFRVIPETAVLVVDGTPMDATVRTIPRPAPGSTLDLVVRAPGFADQSLKIDDDAPSAVDVWLTEKSGGTKKPAAPAAPRAPETLPANPY